MSDPADLLPDVLHVYPTWGPEHDTDGGPCWCGPEKQESETGAVIWVHREPPQ